MRRWSPARGPVELVGGLGVAPEPLQQVAPHAGEEVVALQRAAGDEQVDQRERVGGPDGHGDGDGPVQLHDG